MEAVLEKKALRCKVQTETRIENETTGQQKTKRNIGQTIQKLGLALTAISGAFLAAPLPLPQLATTIITYLGVIGTIATTVGKIMGDDLRDLEKNLPGKSIPVQKLSHS